MRFFFTVVGCGEKEVNGAIWLFHPMMWVQVKNGKRRK